jgi:protein phosphatase
MRTFSRTDTGVKREMNQDYFFSSETAVGNLPNLFLVADGMGGHKAGEYASRYTIERIVASISRNPGNEPVKIFKDAIQKANDLLIAESKEDETKNGMGTTLVAATIVENRLFVANVGDSRLYVVSDHIRQITKDHSLVEEMVRLGEMEEKEARQHPSKNIITRAIGAAETVEADFFEVELGEKDTVLLCSDGLTNMVEDSAIETIIFSKESVEAKVNELIQTANANGGRDNITATIIQPFSDEVKTC